ncbi:hypothetical protein TSOC_009519 [Tetrabaena socialis]|uniref:Uncharacterized protein n=1 Tax=Tetrabaena socialis TaxID=47790 RepID=A0A2J7ZVN2_9CHLO|nr:hypothetical protein TSOC_009519 [Tetrabaena socialis]|eukprot:PNH04326.1 hypothetical protein TSOC_009519 [Tetrabaena socialis]
MPAPLTRAKEIRVAPSPGSEAVPPEHRGKYLGVLDRVPELQAMGATTVLLGPVALSGPTPGADPAAGARSPLSLMAPDPSLAVAGPLAAAGELKQLVRGLHAAGLEVMLQVGGPAAVSAWPPANGP